MPTTISVRTADDVERLLALMTLEEKAGQLNQPPVLDTITDEQVVAGQVGSVICAHTAFAGNEAHNRVRTDLMNRIQRVAVEESRLGIPIVYARDVIHGYRTVAPIPLGQAASFSPDHVREAQKVAAKEASADGIRWTFTPMLDIGRDPRWGRVAEGFGEDPYLTSVLGAAAVEGIQGERMTMAACFKHFAGYGTAEGGRDYNTGEITEYTYRNLILRPFHAAVRAGCATAMAAFLEVGGVPATSNDWLLRDVLRDEWGFAGVVVSDWGAVDELMCHGQAADKRHAALLALTAGTDIDMASYSYLAHVPDLVRSGALCPEVLDEAVRRVLLLKLQLGLFENPYADESTRDADQFTKASRATVLELARRCLVLLKNGGALPLKGANVLLFGELAYAQRELFGTWTMDGVPSDVVTVATALRSALSSETKLVETHLIDDAVSFSRFCDVAVVVVGESPNRSGENNSVTDLGLPAGQLDQLRALRRVGVPIVTVVVCGRALVLTEVEELSDAVLLAFHPGVMGGTAIAEALTGKVNPSGRLPITFPRHAGQVPVYYARKNTGRPTNPSVRKQSRYIDSSDTPLHPFGFGLGYAEVGYGDPQMEGWTASVELTNEGLADAEETVQLYLRDELSTRVRPLKELIGFTRVLVPAGGRADAKVEFSPDSLGYYGPDNRFVVEPGWFQLALGRDSEATPFVRFRLDDSGGIVEATPV